MRFSGAPQFLFPTLVPGQQGVPAEAHTGIAFQPKSCPDSDTWKRIGSKGYLTVPLRHSRSSPLCESRAGSLEQAFFADGGSFTPRVSSHQPRSSLEKNQLEVLSDDIFVGLTSLYRL